MIIALMGDVHANLPALEAVLAHARENGAETIWNLGDLIGFGAFPDAVVQRLSADGAVNIRGNYERKVLKFKKKAAEWRLRMRPEKLLVFQWADAHLSESSRDVLRNLPKQLRLEVEGWRFLLVHGSPEDQDEYLTPETPEERLRQLGIIAAADGVLCAHSHQPFARRVDGVWFINPGSVGGPDDGDPRASYVLLTISPGQLTVAHQRVVYDIQAEVDALRRQELPEVFAQMVIQGRNLDNIRDEG
jgi:putative phosphoesterase